MRPDHGRGKLPLMRWSWRWLAGVLVLALGGWEPLWRADPDVADGNRAYTDKRYDDAIAAYDRALALKPDFAEAIEYRGHAYLGLNRLADAKDAYLTLFSANRKLAGQLLAGMQTWVGEHRGNPEGVDGAALEAFASWVNERSAIASQTAGLTREGASAAW